MQSKTKLLLVVNFLDGKDPFKVGGVEYHRQLIPYINLAKTHNIEVHQTNEITENINLSDFDLVVFSRVVSNYNRDEEVLQRLQKTGIPFIIDIDDHWRLPTNHLLYKQWHQHNMVKRIEMALKNATAVTTTTPHLASKIRKLNKKVIVAPNAIDPDQPQFKPRSDQPQFKPRSDQPQFKPRSDQPQFKPRSTQSDTTRIGWVGGLCHTDDIPLLERGFKKLYAEKELQWKYTVNLCGYSPQNFDVWGYYEHIFTAGQQQPNYHRVPGRDIRNYAYLYNGLDVCLVPLADTSFNRCKSPLKLLEAGWFKKACITSKVYPYTLMGKHYKNLLFVENNKIDWHKNMKKLIQNPNLQQDLAESLHQTVKENYLINKVNVVRGELIQELITETAIQQ